MFLDMHQVNSLLKTHTDLAEPVTVRWKSRYLHYFNFMFYKDYSSIIDVTLHEIHVLDMF